MANRSGCQTTERAVVNYRTQRKYNYWTNDPNDDDRLVWSELLSGDSDCKLSISVEPIISTFDQTQNSFAN